MVMLRRKRVLGVAIEDTPGVAEDMTSAPADQVLFPVYDANMQPNIQMNERENERSMGTRSSVPGLQGGTCTFTVYPWAGAMGGDVPKWAELLLPACALVDNGSGVFLPRSEAPGDNVKTLTLALFIDGQVKQMRGCAGTAVFTFNAGEIAMIEFTFTGIWIAPSVAAVPANATGFEVDQPQSVRSGTLTIAGIATPVQSLTFDLGNEVALGEDITDPSGYAHATVGDRRIVGTINPEAITAATRYTNLTGGAETTLAFQLGTPDLNIAATKFQLINVQEGERDNRVTDDIDFQLNNSTPAGDDEFSLNVLGTS